MTSSCVECGRPLTPGRSDCPSCSATTPGLALPELGNYRVVRLLGEGGMGAVFLAEDKSLGRMVAIKRISTKVSSEEGVRERFVREARAMARVEHPNVARVYSFETHGDEAWIVMEYVEGESLATRIRSKGRLEVADAVRIVRAVAEGLEEAWQSTIVHRDLKPSNILLDKRGQPRIVDFGLAKPVELGRDAEVTHSGQIVGTPHYLSPEQACGEPVDFRADIYSLGVVLFEMLTGARPFVGSSPISILAKHLHDPLPRVRDSRADVPEEVAELVVWMTEKVPASRPASYRELIERIDTITAPMVAESGATIQRPSRRSTTIPQWRLVAAALLSIIAIAAGGWYVATSRPDRAGGAAAVGDGTMTIAVTPFYGPDEESTKEGKVLAALAERSISQKLGESVRVIGIDVTKSPVRGHDAARALGESLGASIVVWGEVFSIHGQTEIQPNFTIVAPKKEASGEEAREAGTLDALMEGDATERKVQPVVLEAQAPNQVELRRTTTEGIGDVVLLLAGIYALNYENDAEGALRFFRQVPRSAESLRYEASALLLAKRRDEAVARLNDALSIDPEDAPSHALLGDLAMEAGETAKAIEHYRIAAASGKQFVSHLGAIYQGRLYAGEVISSRRYGNKAGTLFTPTLLVMDSVTRRVEGRWVLPGAPVSFAPERSSLRVGFDAPPGSGAVRVDGTTIEMPPFHAWYLERSATRKAGFAPLANFLPVAVKARPKLELQPKQYDDAPATLEGVEAVLRTRMAADPTQPWNRFWLGQVYAARGRGDDAGREWAGVLADDNPGIPWYEWSVMGSWFEFYGQREWADRALDRAKTRRAELAQPALLSTLFERILATPFIRERDDEVIDPDRAWALFARARELTGDCPEGDDFAAAVWNSYFSSNGQEKRASEARAIRDRVRALASNPGRALARLDIWYFLACSTIIGLFFICYMLVLRWIIAVMAIPKGERGTNRVSRLRALPSIAGLGTLLLLLVTLLLTSLGIAAQLTRFGRIVSLPLVAGDSLGHPSSIKILEETLATTDSPAVRWVLGAACQLAGRRDQARAMYQSLPPGERVSLAMKSLSRGERRAPAGLSSEDLSNAFAAVSPAEWLDPRRRKLDSEVVDLGGLKWVHGFATLSPVLLAGIVLLVVLMLIFPSQRSENMTAAAARLRSRTPKLTAILLPGAFDVYRGRILRGSLTLLAGLPGLLVMVFHLGRVSNDYPALGPFSAAWLVNPRSYLLPVHSLDMLSTYRWQMFFLYPEVGVFVAVTMTLTLLVLVHHARSIRGILASFRNASGTASAEETPTAINPNL